MNSIAHQPIMTDTELLTRFVRDKDRDSLAEIVQRYERLVWSVCQRTLRNRSDVEDAFQITFLTLTSKASQIRKRKSLSNWLFGVAKRTSLNIRKQRASLLLEDMAEPIVSCDYRTQSELNAIRKQNEIDLVDQLINALPTTHRAPLVMKYFSGMTAQQIADQMNLTVSAVEGRIRRARAQLSVSLRRAGYTAGENDGSLSNSSAFYGLVVLDFVSRPARVSATASSCVAAASGSVAGGVTGLTFGSKIMICKTFCIVSMGAMMSAALILHPRPIDSSDSIVVGMVSPESQEDASTVSLNQEGQDGVCCLDCCEACCECCCEDGCPGMELLNVAHDHLRASHMAINASIHGVAAWMHGVDD